MQVAAGWERSESVCTLYNYTCLVPTKSGCCENILIACSFLNIHISACVRGRSVRSFSSGTMIALFSVF